MSMVRIMVLLVARRVSDSVTIALQFCSKVVTALRTQSLDYRRRRRFPVCNGHAALARPAKYNNFEIDPILCLGFDFRVW